MDLSYSFGLAVGFTVHHTHAYIVQALSVQSFKDHKSGIKCNICVINENFLCCRFKWEEPLSLWMAVRDLLETPGSKRVVLMKHYRSVDQIRDIRRLKLDFPDGSNWTKYDGNYWLLMLLLISVIIKVLAPHLLDPNRMQLAVLRRK